jgi:serine/threonine-protein kinase 24/25/MST4
MSRLSIDCPAKIEANDSFSNAAVRQHVQTSRGLFPHKRVIRRSELTSKGLVVTEEEEISGLPTLGSPAPIPIRQSSHGASGSSSSAQEGTPGSPVRKSPIAELLYMRWLEGLKLKWPLGG